MLILRGYEGTTTKGVEKFRELIIRNRGIMIIRSLDDGEYE